MKIGILTFWWSEDNYGQILQCFALQKYLNNIGHNAFLIRCRPGTNKKELIKKSYNVFNPKKLYKYLQLRKNKKDSCNFNLQHPRGFEAFRQKNIKMTEHIFLSKADLKKNFPEMDLCLVGSDQIWNFRNKESVLDSIFTLDFVDKQLKKASYAASFGRSELDIKTTSILAKRLKNFSAVTVREDSGLEICSKMDIKADVVCDPTLLLSIKDYELLFDSSLTPKKTYIFLYLLSNPCEISVKLLKQWADKNSLSLIYVIGNKGWLNTKYDDEEIRKDFLSINQWLDAIYNAKYVITNSFHCCLFSLLFQKRVCNVPLIGELASSNNRISSLFNKLDCKLVQLKDNNFDVLKELDESIPRMDFVEESKEILNNILRT